MKQIFIGCLLALFLAGLMAGCGGGGDAATSPGATDTPGTPPGTPSPSQIIPGAACSIAGPKVTLSNPTSGNLVVTTSTNGVAGGGKLITATFSEAMDPLTLVGADTFTVVNKSDGSAVAGAVTYTAATKVATFTTTAALLPGTAYTAAIKGAVKSALNVQIGCDYVWDFKTAALASTGLAPVNLGLAAPFGITATAGLATAGGPSTVNGDVLLQNPAPVCNATTVPGTGLIGSCAAIGFPPTINGTVISPLYDPAGALANIATDLNTAFLSITPPAGPPAAGSLGGGTAIFAPTTLGTGSTGQSTFTPGVYTSGTSILITGDLTLDAQGDTDAVFIFQSGSTVGTAAGAAAPAPHTRILLVNGAKASNVWWQAASSATVNTFTEFQGNVVAAVSITFNQGSTACGRMMAGAWVGGGGAITLDRSVVSVPGNVNAPPTCQ